MSTREQQIAIQICHLLHMQDIEYFTSSANIHYVTGQLNGRYYCFSHKLHECCSATSYILSVDGDMRITTFDPTLIINAINIIRDDPTAIIPQSLTI